MMMKHGHDDGGSLGRSRRRSLVDLLPFSREEEKEVTTTMTEAAR